MDTSDPRGQAPPTCATLIQKPAGPQLLAGEQHAAQVPLRDTDLIWQTDFMTLSEAFGVHGMRAKSPTDVGRLVGEAIALNRPVLLEVPVGAGAAARLLPPAQGADQVQALSDRR